MFDREPRAESREPRAESREPRAESREPRAESREPRAESREPRAESREPRAESREPRAESREPRAESREPRAESREPRAESREPRAESREPRAESREPRAESREPSCVRNSPGRAMPRLDAASRSAPPEPSRAARFFRPADCFLRVGAGLARAGRRGLPAGLLAIVLLVFPVAAGAGAGNATGRPSFSGQPIQTGVITAITSGIGDPDGVDTGTFAYEWLRCDSTGNNCNTTAGTASTYTLTNADIGFRFRLRVNFEDSDGNAESRTSFPWPSRSGNAIYAYPACAESDLTSLDSMNRTAIWTGTLTVGFFKQDNTSFYGRGRRAGTWYGQLTDSVFSIDSKNYRLRLLNSEDGGTGDGDLNVVFYTATNEALGSAHYAAHRAALEEYAQVHICDKAFVISEASNSNRSTYVFLAAFEPFLSGSTRTIRVSVPNSLLNAAPESMDNSVATNEDEAYTFQVSDFHFTDPDMGARSRA